MNNKINIKQEKAFKLDLHAAFRERKREREREREKERERETERKTERDTERAFLTAYQKTFLDLLSKV